MAQLFLLTALVLAALVASASADRTGAADAIDKRHPLPPGQHVDRYSDSEATQRIARALDAVHDTPKTYDCGGPPLAPGLGPRRLDRVDTHEGDPDMDSELILDGHPDLLERQFPGIGGGSNPMAQMAAQAMQVAQETMQQGMKAMQQMISRPAGIGGMFPRIQVCGRGRAGGEGGVEVRTSIFCESSRPGGTAARGDSGSSNDSLLAAHAAR